MGACFLVPTLNDAVMVNGGQSIMFTGLLDDKFIKQTSEKEACYTIHEDIKKSKPQN